MLHHVITFALPFAGVCAAQIARRGLIVCETVALRVALDIGKHHLSRLFTTKELDNAVEGVEIAVQSMAESAIEDLM
ncbi:MAG TPA: hypothetical protein VHY82_16000 [Acetobacteraceae bacterium]|jgi:hypothetical protein|nr:hypothetical protein [Acetobacteraceae bacterium]